MRHQTPRVGLMGTIVLVVFAVLAGLAVGGWQWADRGITVEVVTVPAILGQWREIGAPTVRGRADNHQFDCADGYAGMGKPSGPALVGGNLQYADPASNPDFVRCYALFGHHEEITESQLRRPELEDLRQAAGAGVVAYLFLLAFMLSNRALTLRPVGPTDTQAVGDVFLAALAGMTYLPELYTEEETRTFIRDVLLPKNEVWVAEDGGRVIGFVGLWGDVVSHLWVYPDQQNQGVGTALLALAKERRPSGLRLQVFQQNVGARRLYERHGFTLVGLADGSGNQEGEPEALYEWRPGEPSAAPRP